MTKPMTPLEYVKALRTLNLTQEQIAERTGIPQSAISKIERGQIHDVLSRRYLALQALYSELFGEELCCGKAKPSAAKRSAKNHPGERAADKPRAR